MRDGRRTAPNGCWDCSKPKLPATAALEMRSPGHAPSRAGELDVAGEIRHRFVGGGAARDVSTTAAAAAARAAGQAAAITHMGAHALGAAGYAAKATALAAPDRPEALSQEIHWQLEHMSAAARAALEDLPPVGENSSGPLGPGLLASGVLGSVIRDLQASLAEPNHTLASTSTARPLRRGAS